MHPSSGTWRWRDVAWTCFAFALLLVTVPAAHAELELVRNGEPVATLVGPSGGSDSFDDAAAVQLLNDWIEKITDVRLPVAERAPAEGVAILVGRSAIDGGLALDDIDSPTREGVRIRTDGRRILIAGQSDRATVKAACRFLEALGCRYFMDTPLGEVHPRTKNLAVSALDITEKPGLHERRAWGSHWHGRDAQLWRLWNGQGGVSFNKGHAWAGYVGAELFEEHPEWFAMNAEGERYNNQWLCTSNSELRRYFADRVIDAIDAGAVNPSISPPDGRGHCQCDACTALDDPESLEVGGVVSKSNRYADFYRAVAERVQEVHPEAILNFYAYADYTLPPTRGEPLPDNLAAWLAPIAYCWWHGLNHPDCTSRQQVRELYDGWSEHVSKFGYREYNYNYGDCTLPFSKMTVWIQDIPYLAEKGLVGIDMETLPCWMVYGPQLYLFQRLAYAPHADADAILDDYFTMFYGPEAGPYVQQYFMAIDEAVVSLTDGEPERGFRGFEPIERIYTPEFLREMRSLIDRAAEAAKGNEKYAARVAMIEQGLINAEQYMQIKQAMAAEDYHEARRIHDELVERNERLLTQGLTNHYTIQFLHRFLARGQGLIHKAATAPPHKILQELPDQWRHRWDKDGTGTELGYHTADFDDSQWETISTYKEKMTNANELNAGRDWRYRWFRTTLHVPDEHDRLLMFFSTLHKQSLIYINGEMVNGPDDRPRGQWGVSFIMDVTDAVRPGENTVAIRRPHAWGWVFEKPALLIEAPSTTQGAPSR